MEIPRLLITGPFDAGVEHQLIGRGFDVDRRDGNISQNELKLAIRGALGYVMGGFEKLTREIVEEADALRVVVFMGEQADTFIEDDAQSLLDEGCIALESAPGLSTNAVAEMACALILSTLRKIPFLVKETQDGWWTCRTGSELAGKTLGVFGMGKIGYTLVKRLSGFDLGAVLYYDIARSEKAENDFGAERVEAECLFRESDVISVHSPLTPETRGIVGQELLSVMKPTAILVNTARAAVVGPHALSKILAEGHIAGAAFDGYYIEGDEFISGGDPYGLIELGERFMATSHQAFNTREAVQAASAVAAEKLIAYCPDVEEHECAHLSHKVQIAA